MNAIDFLARGFEPVGSVTRERDVFQTKTPWAMARYAGIALARGWWELESQGNDDELEVRIRDDTGLIFAFRPARQDAINLFLGESTIVDFDLVFCAWPGRVAFRSLKFKRLTSLEVAIFLGRRARHALAGGRPIARMSKAARQWMSRSSFGALHSATGAVLTPEADAKIVDASHSLEQKAVHKDFTFVIDEGSKLDERAMDLVADVFRTRLEVNAVYGDVLEGGKLLPAPQWDEERARWFPFARLPIFFRGNAEGLTAQNAWSRLKETVNRDGATGVLRIPLPLATHEGERVFERPRHAPAPPVRDNWPTVSVVIPTKHRTDLLANCLESLRKATGYPSLEIIVVDNGADDAALGPVLEAASAHHRVVRVYDSGEFNFSRLINAGVKASSGEIVLLLNDDVAALEPGWLHRMVDSAMDMHTGAVGARLLYTSGAIQHAGVMMGLGGICGHLWRHQSAEAAKANPHIIYPGRRTAVTGACLAVRRAAFDSVNGLDEINYPVTLNDIDFCLRLGREGLRTIYRGDAVLLHDESQSRGSDDEERRKRERRRGETSRFRKMWGHMLDDDPFGSPAFDISTETGAVRYSPRRPGD